MLKEFREFIARGNVLDLAIGVIIGGAFGKIVTSLVEDVIMPPIGLILGKVDLSNLFFSLNGKSYPTLKAAKDAAAPVVAYGNFFNQIVQFLIVAFAIFMIVKAANAMRRRMEEQAKTDVAVPPTEEAKEDPQTKMMVQNEKMIELLSQIAARP